MLAFAADRISDGDLSLILLILAIVAFVGALYLCLAVHQYAGALIAVAIGVILLVLSA